MKSYKADCTYGLVVATTYDSGDMLAAWKNGGQGHEQAVARGEWCVLLRCDENLATKLAREFCEDFFNIPTCTHYDGVTLSCYCGDAGRGADSLRESWRNHLKGRRYRGIA